MFHNIKKKIHWAGRPLQRKSPSYFLSPGNFLLLEEQEGNSILILIYFPWQNKVRNRHSMNDMLPMFCQFVLSVENRLAHRIWNGDCIPLLNKSLSPSRRECGWALAGSVFSLGAQKVWSLHFSREMGREALRGASTHTVCSCRAEGQPTSHILGAAAGTDSSFHTKVGGHVFLNKAGLGM